MYIYLLFVLVEVILPSVRKFDDGVVKHGPKDLKTLHV